MSVTEWSDQALACALLVLLWRQYDAMDMSHGRSYEGRLLEGAQLLLRAPYPPGVVETWPTAKQLLDEAKRRTGVRPRLVKQKEKSHG